MPKQRRWAIKQSLFSVIKELERASDKVVVIAQPFKEHHPDYFERFSTIVLNLELTKKLVKEIRDDI